MGAMNRMTKSHRRILICAIFCVLLILLLFQGRRAAQQQELLDHTAQSLVAGQLAVPLFHLEAPIQAIDHFLDIGQTEALFSLHSTAEDWSKAGLVPVQFYIQYLQLSGLPGGSQTFSNEFGTITMEEIQRCDDVCRDLSGLGFPLRLRIQQYLTGTLPADDAQFAAYLTAVQDRLETLNQIFQTYRDSYQSADTTTQQSVVLVLMTLRDAGSAAAELETICKTPPADWPLEPDAFLPSP